MRGGTRAIAPVLTARYAAQVRPCPLPTVSAVRQVSGDGVRASESGRRDPGLPARSPPVSVPVGIGQRDLTIAGKPADCGNHLGRGFVQRARGDGAATVHLLAQAGGQAL